MKSVFALLSLFVAVTASAEPMPLQYDAACMLKAVLKKKNLPFKPDIAIPPVFVESKTPIKQFQDAIEPQWNMRPERFLNAYALKRNEIYLMDDSEYYTRHGRFVDDSLAHELTHYVQAQYQGFDLNDDSLESDAIDVQNWVRQEYMKTGKSPCQAN